LLYIFALQATVGISTALDIPIFRQVLGFIFLAFIPGFLILRAFKIERQHLAEIIVLSVGLSLAFLMLVGVLMNELGSLGILNNPLATDTLSIVINVVIACICVVSYFTNNEYKGIHPQNWGKFWRYLPFLLLPILSIIGVLFVSYFHSNLFSISVIVLIAIVFVSSALRSRLSSYYPLILISIVLAVLLSSSLMSNYLYGDDVQSEFRTFTTTKNALFWNPQNYMTIQQSSDNSMLSITILPTMLSNLLNIEPTWIFKIIYLIIFSLVPIGLYELYRRQWNERVAFVSVFFFVANYVFFTGTLGVTKQIIGELFYVILFLELLAIDANRYKSSWVILIFALFGLVVSHYSMDFIFIILIFSTWIGTRIFRKKIVSKINNSIIVFTSCIVFFWYIYIVPTASAGPFQKFVGVIRTTFNSFFSEFLQTSSRGDAVQNALGVTASPTMLHNIGTILYDLTILVILIGFISLLFIAKKDKTKREYTLLISVNIILLILAVILPRFADFLSIGRLYEILLILLSPLFVLGTDAVFNALKKIGKRKNLKIQNIHIREAYSITLALIIAIPFFLFQTGLVYEITGDPLPSSYTLSYYKMQSSSLLIPESDFFSAQWLSAYCDINSLPTYSDTIAGSHVLASYTNINPGSVFLLSNTTQAIRADGVLSNLALKDTGTSYIYLRQFNVQSHTVWWYEQKGLYFNLTQLPILNSTQAFVNKIYSNGGSEVYFRISR
jgi:uncharacterized membrane protein